MSQRFIFGERCFATCGGDGARSASAEEGADDRLEDIVYYKVWGSELGYVCGEEGGCEGGEGGCGVDVT